MKVSKIAEHLVGSEIVKIGNYVNDLKSQGAEIANLTIGDLNAAIYPIPLELKEGIKKAYDHNLTNYPPASGILPLRTAISKDLKSRWNLDYDETEILVAAGSRPLIYAFFETIVDPGDKVIFPVPSWNNNHYSYLTSAEKVEVKTSPENNFLPIASDLKPHLQNAVLLALCSPQNPTGTMYTKKQLTEICEMVVEENKRRGEDEKPLYLMYDQIYAMLTFEDEHFNPVSLFPELKKYTVFIDGISKSFAATGVRVGWSFGPAEIISKMQALLTHVGAWAPKPEQHAVSVFLEDTNAVNRFVNYFKGKIALSLNTLHQEIQNLKNRGFAVESIQPMGAFYLTIKLDYLGKTTPEGLKIESSTDLVFYLIKEAGMALVPFSAFGNASDMMWFRASAGGVSLEEINLVMPRLADALEKLN